jgi:Cytochrome P460
MRIIPIHSAKRRSSRTKLSHAGAATAMVVLAVGLAALGSAASAVAQEAAKVDYPTGYRDWTHVKSMVIQPGHQLYESFGGIHHIYANQSALEGYRTGSFADGSVIIFDLLEATAADNAITEGKRKVLGVMQKDGKRFAGTGGWGFEGFAAARWSARPPIRTTPRNERSAHD